MNGEPADDLLYRLLNPMWAHSNAPFESPQLEKDDNLVAMREAADEIKNLRADLKLAEDIIADLMDRNTDAPQRAADFLMERP